MCPCGPSYGGMKRFHIMLAIASVLIVHFVVVQLAKAGYLKVSPVGKISQA